MQIILANWWNKRVAKAMRRRFSGGLPLGNLVQDGRPSKQRYFWPSSRRTEHAVIIGKTGSGKSYLILSMMIADLLANRGFILFDFHRDLIYRLLAFLAEHERNHGVDLSKRVVVLQPYHPTYSFGFNPLQVSSGARRFVEIASIVSVLKERWGLASFGAQTEEILRNTLHLAADNGLTLVELVYILSDAKFRARCLAHVTSPEVRFYFEQRFEPMSEAMKATVRNPILNKVSEFVSDPHFRDILGQAQTTVSIEEAMTEGKIVLCDLSIGHLGAHSATLASLLFGQTASAIFRRRSRQLFTLYCDEVQNLVTAGTDIDVLLAESRKFGVGLVTTNQFLQQFPPTLRAAIQAIGTQICFQLSSDDATGMSAVMSGGKTLAEILKSLPKRQFAIRTGNYTAQLVQAPTLEIPKANFTGLLERSIQRHARLRTDIEREIQGRVPRDASGKAEALHDWE